MYVSFLDKSSRRKIEFLQHLENSVSLSERKSDLSDELNLSEFLINKTIQELNSDFEIFGLSNNFKISCDGIKVKLHEVGSATSLTLLAHYLENSIKYALMKECFFEQLTSIYDFATEHFLSHNHVYKEFKVLKNYLQEHDIKINSQFQLSGLEYEIREFMFIILLKEACMKETVFPAKILKQVEKFEKLITNQDQVKSPSIRRNFRLQHYISVIVTRIQHGHSMNYAPEEKLEKIHELSFVEEVKTWLGELFTTMDSDALDHEVEGIIRFLIAEGWIEKEMINTNHSYINKLNNQFLDYLTMQIPAARQYNDLLRQELNLIHYQLLNFPLVSESEHQELEISYFFDTYPEYFYLCKKFFVLNKAPILRENKDFLFYQYLILLITMLPLQDILAPVYLCVDFLRGNLYNQMIKKNIEKMAVFTVVFQTNPDEKTNLILSDTTLYKTSGVENILWTAPPRPNDWMNFMEKILKIRRNSGILSNLND